MNRSMNPFPLNRQLSLSRSAKRHALSLQSIRSSLAIIGFFCCISNAFAEPVALNDFRYAPFNTSIAIDVLVNVDPNGSTIDPSSVEVVSGPANGQVEVDATGVVTYTPDVTFEGEDSFDYRVSDTSGQVSNTATVNVNVDPNLPPVIDSISAEYDGGMWTITGTVIDEFPDWIEVKFAEALYANVPVAADGSFVATMVGDPDTEYYITLQAVDTVSGQTSNVEDYWLYPYY